MKIAIAGAGNAATSLAYALKQAGHHIIKIYNRSATAGKQLAEIVDAQYVSNPYELVGADVYLIAVKDDAINQVAKHVQAHGKIVAHTSGTKPMNVLSISGSNYGIFYPLQTMNKTQKVDFKQVPLLVEGSNTACTAQLEELAKSISNRVYIIDEEERQWIHLAAVFANNFTNHLLGISENLLEQRGISFEILKPLIFSFIQNLETHSPAQLQTGPAARSDRETIERHLQLLGNNERLQKIYTVLTESIMASISGNDV
jgi:predicted short-subunit dehydrogenase-like oxidoreductase (DUF2520 family)